MKTRNWRVTCGRTKRFAVQTQVGQAWVTAATADTEVALTAAVARTQARCPERAIRTVEFTKRGERLEQLVATEATALARAA